MNTQEHKKNNKLIAEFMGGKWLEWVRIIQCQNDWSFLMDVVEKIECTTTDNNDNSDSFFNVMIEVFECNINGGDICICKSGNTKREATYNAVVEFINEYNKTK